MKLNLLLPTMFVIITILSSCKQGQDGETSTNEPKTTDDEIQYQEQDLAEGAIWGELEINNFIQEAAGIDQMQIKVAEIAKERSEHEAVGGYAEKLRTDHMNSLNKLKHVAQDQGINLVDSTNAEQQQKVRELENVDTDFDKYFLEMMVKAHKKDISKYENAMKNIPDNHDLKAWVDEALPVMQQHLYQAEKLLKDASIFPME